MKALVKSRNSRGLWLDDVPEPEPGILLGGERGGFDGVFVDVDVDAGVSVGVGVGVVTCVRIESCGVGVGLRSCTICTLSLMRGCDCVF